jgi:cytochrome c oxidase assembly protein subunit 15
MFGLALLRGGVPKQVWRRYAVVWVVALAQGALGIVQYALGVPEGLVSLHVLGSTLVIIATAALWCASRSRGPAVASDVSPSEAGELTATG